MAPPARRPPRSGQWALIAVGAVVFVVAVDAGYAFLTREQASLPVAPASAAPVLSPTPDAQAVAAELMQLAPELTPIAARMLMREVPSATGHGLAEIGWLMATRGFDGMERDDLRDLRALIDEVYAPLAPEDQAWMAGYLNLLREGGLSREDGERGRRLFTEGVNKLAPERRQRLQALVENARKNGVILGLFLFGTSRVGEFLEKGFTFISIGNDLHHVLTQSGAYVKDMESISESKGKAWKRRPTALL